LPKEEDYLLDHLLTKQLQKPKDGMWYLFVVLHKYGMLIRILEGEQEIQDLI
jgi:hypothetical protein